MTESSADPTVSTPLIVLGEPHATVCEGDVCDVPDHPEQRLVNRRLDDDLV